MNDIPSILHYITLELEKQQKIKREAIKPISFRNRLRFLFGIYEGTYSNIVTKLIIDMKINFLREISEKISSPEIWKYIRELQEEHRTLDAYKNAEDLREANREIDSLTEELEYYKKKNEQKKRKK